MWGDGKPVSYNGRRRSPTGVTDGVTRSESTAPAVLGKEQQSSLAPSDTLAPDGIPDHLIDPLLRGLQSTLADNSDTDEDGSPVEIPNAADTGNDHSQDVEADEPDLLSCRYRKHELQHYNPTGMGSGTESRTIRSYVGADTCHSMWPALSENVSDITNLVNKIV